MDLEVLSDNTQWLNNDEFLSKYQVTRDQLNLLTGLISGAEVFRAKTHGPIQIPVKHQLMIYLHFIGHEAMTDRIQRQVFLVSRGTITSTRNWVIKAFFSIRDQYYKWPSSEERKSMSDNFLKNHGIPNGCALMDGTLLELLLFEVKK